MQLESYALLVGSLGIFVILAIAMYASQKKTGIRNRGLFDLMGGCWSHCDSRHPLCLIL